jgi:hypothetical protein
MMKVIQKTDGVYWPDETYFAHLKTLTGKRMDTGFDSLILPERVLPTAEGTFNDAWLQRLCVYEDDVRLKDRSRMFVEIDLVGPQFDRLFKLRYSDVVAYESAGFQDYLDLQFFEVTVEADLIRNEFVFIDDVRLLVIAKHLDFSEQKL